MATTISLVAGLIPISRVAHGQRPQFAWLERGGGSGGRGTSTGHAAYVVVAFVAGA